MKFELNSPQVDLKIKKKKKKTIKKLTRRLMHGGRLWAEAWRTWMAEAQWMSPKNCKTGYTKQKQKKSEKNEGFTAPASNLLVSRRRR